MLYFTRLDRKPSVGVHQTQFYCQNPRLELDVRTRLVGASAVAAMQRPLSPKERGRRRSFQAHTKFPGSYARSESELQVGVLHVEFHQSDSRNPWVRENVASVLFCFSFCFVPQMVRH